MKSNDTRPRGRRHQRGGRRYNNRNERSREQHGSTAPNPRKMSFWQKLVAFFTGGKKQGSSPARSHSARREQPARREQRKPEQVEVTTPKLYVGNLSYEASESDLYELFNGVGKVQNAEIVTDRASYKSKGFGFVTMLTVDEARRAVQTLHDKPFMGRSLVVTGSKSDGPRL